MEELFAFVVAILVWRIVLSIAAGLALALSLASAFAWFNGLMGGALVFVAYFAGYAWHARAHGQPLFSAQRSLQTSTPVAALAFAFYGCLWGFLGNTSFGSTVAAAVLLVATALAFGWWHLVVRKRAVPLRHAVLYACTSIVGFVVPVTLLAPIA